jgi:hypothetical protein
MGRRRKIVTHEDAKRETRKRLLHCFDVWAALCPHCTSSAHSRNAFIYGVGAAVVALSETDPDRRGDAARLLFEIADDWHEEQHLLHAPGAPVV